jgi:hypothetical protein
MFRGGESQKSKAFLNPGYSDKAQCTGKPAANAQRNNCHPARMLPELAETLREHATQQHAASADVETIYKGGIVFSEH